MATIYKTLLKHIDLHRSIKRPWWDITALWRGRYKTLHVVLPKSMSGGSYFKDIDTL